MHQQEMNFVCIVRNNSKRNEYRIHRKQYLQQIERVKFLPTIATTCARQSELIKQNNDINNNAIEQDSIYSYTDSRHNLERTSIAEIDKRERDNAVNVSINI